MIRTIPKRTNVKNTVYRCWGIADLLVALVLIALAVVCVSAGSWPAGIAFAVVCVAAMMPTQDGILYAVALENARFLFARKTFGPGRGPAGSVRALLPLKDIRADGSLEFDGGLLARAFEIGQKNFALEAEEEQDADISFLSQALKRLEPGFSADLVKVERPRNFDAFSAEVYPRLLRAGKETGPGAEAREAILRERLGAIDEMNNLKRRYVPRYYLVVYGRSASDGALESLSEGMARDIRRAGLEVRALGPAEAAAMVRSCHDRSFDEREAASVPEDGLAGWASPKKVTFRSGSFSCDGAEGSVMAVSDYPLSVRNAWGAQLFTVPGTKAVMHFAPVERDRAIKRIDRCVSDMETKSYVSYKASDRAGADTHLESMERLLSALQRENESLLDVTVCVTAYRTGPKDSDYRKRARRALSAAGFRTSTLFGLQREGFVCSSPVPPSPLPRFARGMDTGTAAAVFPFTRVAVQDRGGVLLGRTRGDPAFLDIWRRDELHQNSNVLVLGKSGSGKSYMMKTLLANEWSDGVRVMVLDPENEYVRLTRALGGTVVDAGNALEGRINPFHIYGVLTEDGESAPPAHVFRAHLKTLESFFRVVLPGAPQDVFELINSLAVEAYARRGIGEDTDCSSLPPEAFPTFSDLYVCAGERGGETGRQARLYIDKFVSGRYSDIWNGPSTMDASSDVMDFSFRSLFSDKNETVANAQMLLIFRFLEQEVINARERNLAGGEGRTMIVVDEAHLFIDEKYPAALDFFYSMSKRIRKYGGAFVPATQNIADWTATEEIRSKTSAIMKNSQYMFFFKLSSPDIEDLKRLFPTDGFTGEELKRMQAAPTGRALLSASPSCRTFLDVRAGDYVRGLIEEKGGDVDENEG